MGASESREDSHNKLVEEKNATPIQNRRILTLQDPRSPSESIHRTPIITDTTDFQDPRSPTAEICRTPVEETADPRSPTEGIPRTPANPFVFPDPRSPSIGITRTPMIKTIEGELKKKIYFQINVLNFLLFLVVENFYKYEPWKKLFFFPS